MEGKIAGDTLKLLDNMPKPTNITTTTCSFTEPNSIVSGCTDAMKKAATNPGALGAGATMAGIAALKKSPIAAVSETLGLEALGTCTYGAINTAVDNCNSTMKTTTIPVLGVDSVLDHP